MHSVKERMMKVFSSFKKNKKSPVRRNPHHHEVRKEEHSFSTFIEEQESRRQEPQQQEKFDEKAFLESLREDADGNDEPKQEQPEEEWKERDTVDPRRQYLVVFMVLVIFIGLFFRFANVPFGELEIKDHQKVLSELQANGTVSKTVNILQLDKEALVLALENDLRFENVSIHYQFPATYVVEVDERKAMAVVMSQMGYAILDRQGQCIGVENSLNGPSIAFISGIKLGNVLLGDTLDNKEIQAAVQFLDIVNHNNRVISEINIGNLEDIIAFTNDGMRVHVGNINKIKEKADLAVKMIRDVRNSRENVKSITLNLQSPYVELAQ